MPSVAKKCQVVLGPLIYETRTGFCSIGRAAKRRADTCAPNLNFFARAACEPRGNGGAPRPGAVTKKTPVGLNNPCILCDGKAWVARRVRPEPTIRSDADGPDAPPGPSASDHFCHSERPRGAHRRRCAAGMYRKVQGGGDQGSRWSPLPVAVAGRKMGSWRGQSTFFDNRRKSRHKRAQHRQKVSGGFWATHM